MIYGQHIIGTEKAGKLVSDALKGVEPGFQGPENFLFKHLINSVEAQQVEFNDGTRLKFFCLSCKRPLSLISTKSAIYGELSVYPSECNDCRMGEWEKHESESAHQAYEMRNSRCGGKQNRIVKHQGVEPRWEILREYGAQDGFLAFIAQILDDQDDKTTQGAYVYGPPGTGKTFLSKALNNDLVSQYRDVAFIKAVDLALLLRKASLSDDGYGDTSRQFIAVKTLIIDDFGTQKNTEFVREVLFSILDHRYDMNKRTIVTSNLPKEDLVSQDERLASRMFDPRFMRSILLRSADLRQSNF